MPIPPSSPATSAAAPPAPSARVVLVGASNLSLYLPTVLAHARAAFGGPLEVLTANGLGRSYGAPSRVLGRELPGIAGCALWDALDAAARRAPLPTAALVTDIGNDVVYGREPAEIAGWVEAVLGRLAPHGARTVVTGLPTASIDALGPRRFALVRALFFPSHRIDLDTLRERALEVDGRLSELARAHDIQPAPPRAAWYGFDPIHIRPRMRHEAWRALLAGWTDATDARPAASLGAREALAARGSRAAQRTVLGRRVTRAQPDRRLADGTTLASY